MTTCPHGRLARSCETCELDDLRAQLEKVREENLRTTAKYHNQLNLWVERCKELEGALKDAATNMEQSHKNYCGPYEPYGRHAPECWLDDAKELRAALARKEGAGD